MSILTWIILGLIVGVVANMIDPTPTKGGILGAIILGIVGALVGGFLSSMIFGIGVSGLNLTSILVATAGALLLLFAGRALRRTY